MIDFFMHLISTCFGEVNGLSWEGMTLNVPYLLKEVELCVLRKNEKRKLQDKGWIYIFLQLLGLGIEREFHCDGDLWSFGYLKFLQFVLLCSSSFHRKSRVLTDQEV